MIGLRIFTAILFTAFQFVIFEASAQNKHLYKGQYHRGKYEPMISLRNIKKREAITLYGNTGYATYYGDLCDGLDCFTFRPQLGAGVMLRTGYLKKRLNLRLEARFFRLYSTDHYEVRDINFRSSNWEVLALGQFDLFPYEKMMRRRPFINPYIVAGIGFMTFDPWGQYSDGKWHKLRPLQTEHVQYGNVSFVSTAGFGLKFRYNYKISFMAEGSYRFTSTDYIDDVSQSQWPDKNSFDNSFSQYFSNPTGQDQHGYRGDPKQNDGYFIFSAGVTYTFTNAHQARFRGRQHLLRKS